MLPTKKHLALVLGLGGLLFTTGCARLQSRDEMNKGVQAYKATKYGDAATHFKKAVELDGTNQNARLYLATSYMTQWVPGADSADNKRNQEAARKGFQDVLERDPKDKIALASLASMAYQTFVSGSPDQKQAALEEAQKWNERRLELDANEPEAYYYLGVIAWQRAYDPIEAARAKAKMKKTDPGPIDDDDIREEMKQKYGTQIEKGVANLHKALDLDKENDDAMTYLNLLLRKKADIEDSEDAAKKDIAQAEEWSNRSLDTKKMKATRPAKKENT